ncbi:beta-lactamase family protein [Saprospiraceae bacterium]|nr:beta-lactamase family protein [Saprospiraceae bacterium]
MRIYLMLLIFFTGNVVFGQTEFQQIDTILSQINEKGEFNGIVLIGNNDNILFTESYGYADFENKTKIDLNTQFYIASISKQFTATAILILSQNGKLKLDQPVKDLLVNFPYEEITIHHLLSNTSGIIGYIDYFAENWNKSKQANTDDVISYLYNIKPDLQFETGSKFQYSNTNYVILAKIIEIVSGQGYPSFLEENIFKPCGLNQSYATSKPYFTDQDTNVAIGYVLENGAFLKAESSNKAYIDRVNYLSGIQGDGSVVTSINDLFLWHKAISSNKLLNESLKQLLFKQTTLSDGNKSYYGYGWYTDEKIADHTGSWPGYQTRIIRNLETGLVGISFKNVEVNNWNWIGEFDKPIKK